MSDVSTGAGGAPWLEEDHLAEKGPTTVTATVIEGAEVVRTAAVSYATPILHQVFIQGSPSPLPQTSVSPATPPSSRELKALRVGMAQSGAAAILPFRDILLKNEDEENMGKENSSVSTSPYIVCSSSSSSSPSPSVPLWVFSSSLLSSNSVVLRPVTNGGSSKQPSSLEVGSIGGGSGGSPIGVSFLSSPSSFSFCSSSSSSSTSSPILSPFPSAKSGTKNDDELTSLSWLQDSNLLLGTALSPIKPQSSSKLGESNSFDDRKRSHKRARKDGVSVAGGRTDEKKESLKRPHEGVEEEFKLESPTSDYGEDTSETSADSPEAVHTTNGNVQSNSSKTQPIPYNPKVHIKAKPPFSFSCLIFMAIEESPTKALPVKDIYSWILDHYPYYRSAPTGWKNSVRHNLSLNKCFSKVEKAPNLGKGSLWMVDPTFRPNLLQAMSKTPFTSQAGLDKNYASSNKAFINTKYLYGLTSKTPEKVITLGDFVVQNEVEVLPSSATMTTHTQPSNNIKAEEEDTFSLVGSYSLPNSSPIQMGRGLLRHPADETADSVEVRPSEPSKVKGRNPNNPNTPNPELFPRLAKRLESHSAELGGTQFETSPIEVQSEDVDAAAAMLVLKHGPRMLSPYHKNYNHMRESPEMNFEVTHNDCNSRSHNNSESSDSGSVVISSSPSQDHAYVIKGNVNRKGSETKVGTHLTSYVERGQGMKSKNTSPTSSVDEAFYDDSFENELMSDPPSSTPELMRPFEEADALLNLAAVATSLASRQEILEEGGITFPQVPFSCIESQPSHSETQVKTQDYSPLPKRLKYNQAISQSPSVISKTNKKLVKRKMHTNLKVSASKKITDLVSSNLTTHNNNNNNVINRNKLLKVRKILKIRKSRC